MKIFSSKGFEADVILQDAQAAVYAADGYARSTGKPTIVVTYGLSDALKAASGMLTPWGDKMPLIIINTGCDEIKMLENIYRAVTRSSFIISHDNSIEDIKKISDRLYLHSPVQVITERGVNLNDLINNLQKNIKLKLYNPTINSWNNQDIDTAINIFTNSKKPVILIGSGAVRSKEIIKQFAELSKNSGAPLLLTASATCMPVPLLKVWRKAHEENKITLIPSGNPVWLKVFASSDVILALGTGLSEVDWFGLKVKLTHAKIIRVSLTEAEQEISRIFIKMDAQEFVKNMLGSLKPSKKQSPSKFKTSSMRWTELINEEAKACKKLDYIEPCLAASEIVNNAPEDTIFVSEGGACGMWLWSYINLRPLVFPVQNGTIGVPVPMSVGVKTGNPENPVWCVVGDGAFFYNIKELLTLKELKYPVVIFVFNDSSWSAIRLGQTFLFKSRYIGTDIESTDYSKIAEIYGCEGTRVNTPQELSDTMSYVKKRTGDCPLVVDIKLGTKDHIPYVGSNFVTAEFDGTLKSLLPDLLVSFIISITRKKFPSYVLKPFIKLLLNK